jgi:hypothetical protein
MTFILHANKYGQPKSLSHVTIVYFLMNKRIFLVDVLGSSSKITMKLNFQPFRTKIHYGFIQSQLDIFGLVKKLVKIQLIYENIKNLKTTFLQFA